MNQQQAESTSTNGHPARQMDLEISSTKGRVGSPPVRPLPLVKQPLSSAKPKLDMDDATSSLILTEATRILDGNGIPQSPNNTIATKSTEDPSANIGDVPAWDGRADLVFRTRPWELPVANHLTLLLEADWYPQTSPAQWERVVRQCKAFLADMIRDGRTQFDIKVEMISTDLTCPIINGPVGDQPGLLAAWPKIQGQIYELLEDYKPSRGTMRCIGIRGTKFAGHNSRLDPSIPTVWVSLDTDCPESAWPELESRILEVLRSRTCSESVALKIEHDCDFDDTFW